MTDEQGTPVIFLRYRREPKTELFTGSITGGKMESHFSAVSFLKMFEAVGDALRCSPELRLLIQREEDGSFSTLPPSMEQLLRTNTPEAVEAMTVPPRRVVISDDRPKPRPPVHTLRQGHDTLADALGDDVYLRSKVNTFADQWLQIESPLTGRWEPVCELNHLLYIGGGKLAVQVILDTESKWAKARVADILALALPRYYLPRRWNATGGWITHEALASLYSQYQKEKADVSTK